MFKLSVFANFLWRFFSHVDRFSLTAPSQKLKKTVKGLDLAMIGAVGAA